MKITRNITTTKPTPLEEIILVYKEIGETSHDLVNQVRKLKNTRKVGHAGVLDPFAEGLVIIGVNGGTKLIWDLEDQDKTYQFSMLYGIKTLSGDHQEVILDSNFNSYPNELEIREVLKSFIGIYPQEVPLLSNVKVNGYKLREITRKASNITRVENLVIFKTNAGDIKLNIPIKDVNILHLEFLKLEKIEQSEILLKSSDSFKESFTNIENKPASFILLSCIVKVSKGTYVRKLAEDIAAKSNQFATLISLKRVGIGNESI